MKNSQIINGLDPIFGEKVSEWLSILEANNLKVQLTGGRRSPAQQDSLYAQGRTKPGKVVTNAKGTPQMQSFHGFGVAVDFVPILNGVAKYDIATMRRCAQYAKDLGLEWGGDWKTFPDFPHLQYTQGKSLSYFQSGGKLEPPRRTEQVSERLTKRLMRLFGGTLK